MRKSRGLYLGIVFVVIVGIAIFGIFFLDTRTARMPEALPLTKTFDQSPTGFTIQYPDEWTYMIPSTGLMMLGPSEVLYDSQPGPTVTIVRAEPLAVVGDLENALDRYLQNGPLRVSGKWQIITPAQATQLEQRDARVVELKSTDAMPIRTRIIATSADNTFVYLFVTSVPEDKLASYQPTFEAMLASIHILE